MTADPIASDICAQWTRGHCLKSRSSRRAVRLSIYHNSSSEAILISQFYRLLDVPSMWYIIPIFKDQTLQVESVSVMLGSNQERSSRLPFIWLDNLLGRMLTVTASIGDIFLTLSFDVRQEVGVVIKEFHSYLRLLLLICPIWRLSTARCPRRSG